MQNGLPDNTVTCICKDSDGFMWFGTGNGLSRYDGRVIRNYSLDGPDVRISALCEIGEGLLAVVTDGYLTMFDRRSGSFTKAFFDNGSQLETNKVFLVGDGLLGCLSENRLKVIAFMEGNGSYRLSEHAVFGDFFKDGARLQIMAVQQGTRRVCLADDRGRIVLLDLDRPQAFRTIELGQSFSVVSLAFDEDCVWLGTLGDGVVYHHIGTGYTDVMTYRRNDSDARLSHTDVYEILKLEERRWLVVTWNGYTVMTVDAAKPDKVTAEVYNNIRELTHRNLESRMITAWYDASGSIWFGTDGGGVIWSDLRAGFYYQWFQGQHNEICSIVADDRDYIWLATFHKGIMRSVRPFHADTHPEFVPVGSKETAGKTTVLCALKDREGNLWFGNRDGTLTCFDPSAGSFSVQALRDHDGNLHPPHAVWSMFIDSSDRFWIGTDNGLLLFDRQTKSCRAFLFARTDGSSLPALFVKALAETADGTLWLGTSNAGLCRMMDDGHVSTGYENTFGTRVSEVRSLLGSSDGHLYVGYVGGLGVVSPAEDRMESLLTVADGLCSDFVGCMTEDADGRLWVGSSSGISYYGQDLFYNYYISGSNRSALCADGYLFFGNNNSLTCFDPKDAGVFTGRKRPVITSLEIDNRPIRAGDVVNGQQILHESIEFVDQIVLNHDNRDFTLAFSNLSFSGSPQKFRYRLWPYQREWLLSDGVEMVSYTNLPAGDYMFEVACIYPDAGAGEVTSLHVQVLPHWSRTTAFRLFVAMLFLAAGVYLVWSLRRRQVRLERQLKLENKLLAVNLERDKEKQLRIERSNFFTNVAHELRTSLTPILSPLTELLQLTDAESPIYEKLRIICRNGESLHYLVDQLLYVQKIEAGMVTMRVSNVDVARVVADTARRFGPTAEVRGLTFRREIPDEPVMLWVDVPKIESVVSNLLSNSVKYTPKGGEICVKIDRVVEEGNGYCRIMVSDTGFGIAKEEQEHIFNSFITGSNSPTVSTGIGIGLHIVKKTVEMHHGRIMLDSAPGHGSRFSILLPEGRAHFPEEICEMDGAATDVRPERTDMPVSYHVAEASQQESGKVLLVIEDNDEVRGYICSLFRRTYRMLEARDGEEGLRLAVTHTPDLIISDVMMPVVDGFTCCRELRANPSTAHIPIIMLTAKSEDADILHGLRIGADDYMMKPFNPEILRYKVMNLIMQREQLKRLYTKALMLRQSPVSNEADNSFIEKLSQVIEMNMGNPGFGVKDLASNMNMSLSTLQRRLHQVTDQTAIEIIRTMRMTKAASLIMENRYSIQEIAEMVGYTDTRTLRKHFTRQFADLPSKFSGD